MQMSEPRHFSPAPRGRVLHAEPMSRHLSWRAGGPARRLYVPRDLDDLCVFLRTVDPAEPLLFVGLGSNLLVRDGGFAGTVVLMHDSGARPRRDGDLVYAPAGLASPKLARFTANQGLEGGEFLAGIPGTIGGALAMNAGCYGSETWQQVARVQTIESDGSLRIRMPAEFELGYRHCLLRPSAVGLESSGARFAGAWFMFPQGDGAAARERVKSLLERRAATQPLNLPNAGSVFRNPTGDFAARLIESCGLKGHSKGGVRVSEKHANFIVNPGGRGTAADIESLIDEVRQRVHATHGVDLIPEVRIVGEVS